MNKKIWINLESSIVRRIKDYLFLLKKNGKDLSKEEILHKAIEEKLFRDCQINMHDVDQMHRMGFSVDEEILEKIETFVEYMRSKGHVISRSEWISSAIREYVEQNYPEDVQKGSSNILENLLNQRSLK